MTISDQIQSAWTIDGDTARRFSKVWGSPDAIKAAIKYNGGQYQLIMAARVDKNPGMFVMGPDALYNVGGLDAHDDEQEVIGLGVIKVRKIFWTHSGAGEPKIQPKSKWNAKTVPKPLQHPNT